MSKALAYSERLPREGGGGRPHQRQLLRVCGLAAVRALFERDPGRIERLFFDGGMTGEVGPFCQILARSHKPYRQVGKSALARVSGTILHGGIVAIVRPRPLGVFDPRTARNWAQDGEPLLVLDGIGNPQNLGAIVRSAAFFGLDRVLLADRPEQALPSDASYRVAEGGFEYLSLYRAPLPAALHELRQVYHVVGTAPVGSTMPTVWAGARPIVLVLGNEERGLDPDTIAACDEVISIPGCGRIQSLNVAAAAAILIHAVGRH